MSKIKTVDFLLELGCEEIPARFLKGLSESIKQGLLDIKSLLTEMKSLINF